MIRYESDEKAVKRELERLGDDYVIDHGTARTIASWFNDFSTAPFVTTGVMYDTVDVMMSDIKRGCDIPSWEAEFNALEAYLFLRAEFGETGKVWAWSEMWVDKHVDYPHEDGQLDTCWCYMEDGDE